MQHILNPQRFPSTPEGERNLIVGLHRVGFVSWSDTPFTLKSGSLSRIYVNGRNDLTDNPAVLSMVAGVVNATVWSVFREITTPADERGRVPCLIGIPTAGTAPAIAAGQFAAAPFPTRIMREKPKDYGNSRGWVEGVPWSRHLYMTFDNVVTDGASKLEAVERLAADGYPVEELVHLILVDRGQGAVEKLRAHGLRVEVIFNLLDIVRAFVAYGLWPERRLAMAEEELAALAA